MLKGTLIKESISNESILDMVVIENVEIWIAENRSANQPKYWTAIFFRVNDDAFINKLADVLYKGWYVDLGDNEHKIVVLKNKVIKYKVGDAKGKAGAIKYCKKARIPESQIDWND